MATKKIKLDPKVDKPERKGDIDKMYIVQYTKLFGSKEQRAAMKECIKENTETRISQLTKKPYTDIKLKAVRDKFCELFFPEFIQKKGKKSFFDIVDEL